MSEYTVPNAKKCKQEITVKGFLPVKRQLKCHLYPSIWAHLLLFHEVFSIAIIHKTPQVYVADHTER